MSIKNIRSNKMRSFLTMLGIIIGVGAVIALITIVQGVTDSIMNEFTGLGAGTISVSAPGTALKSGLTEADLETLKNVPGVKAVNPTVSVMTSAVADGEVYDKVSIDGESAVYFQNNDVIESGQTLSAADMSGDSYVCIVDHSFIDNCLWGKKVLGSTILLDGYEYTVIGVRKKDDSVMGAMTDTSSYDGTVIVPYRNALKMSGARNITGVDVYSEEGASSDAVVNNLRDALDSIYNDADNAYSVFSMDSLLSTMNTVKTMLQTMLGGIASISLVVGGIGIMNMMLVSVSERTKEIGLRKALGAEPMRIQMQFLIEAVVLSVFGGIIGVIIGEIVAYVGAVMLKTTYSASVSAIMLGLGFSLAVGIVFGWAPARRASRLNPIDALRAE
ncbi:MAG: ABC transporter permease [Lachnospiraceae bacterium]|nr:ABC transporter permease [Lachnospiraceae bacterium]MCH4029439.1 ABC transporter permease [Lachnospiraceae bacterium]MCH4067711.1 ABC transporter permease [Lachnospiraceae bacterium]MCH4113733.1 ABC transporter permease [Lachnospiraceae bacterium]MCI1353595.1 ABC transporter permease [Lachnospiraceae bacterium]